MMVAPARYTASSFASMKTRGSIAVCVPLVLMREGGNTLKMRFAISSAIILDLGLPVTTGQYFYLRNIPYALKAHGVAPVVSDNLAYTAAELKRHQCVKQ